jgi:hypothetical protein
MSFIVSKTYVLDNATDYTPGVTGGPITDDQSWVMNIHILVTNTADVEITHAGGSVTIFPTGSLVAGATYPYSVQSIVLDPADADSILGMAPNGKVRFF